MESGGGGGGGGGGIGCGAPYIYARLELCEKEIHKLRSSLNCNNHTQVILGVPSSGVSVRLDQKMLVKDTLTHRAP